MEYMGEFSHCPASLRSSVNCCSSNVAEIGRLVRLYCFLVILKIFKNIFQQDTFFVIMLYYLFAE